jgi:N-acetylmuramoyl-L-alanine amidase
MLASSIVVMSLLAMAGDPPALLDAARATAIIEALAGTDAQQFPAALSVSAADVEGAPGQVVAVLSGLPSPAARARLEVLHELRRETILGALSAVHVEGGVALYVRDAAGGVRPLGEHASSFDGAHSAPPRRRVRTNDASDTSRHTSARFPFGAPLLGMRVALSPGHGWLDNGDTYDTQRSNFKFSACGSSCRGILEDFFTSEVVMDHIVPLLQGMGATILLVREGDHSIGDDPDGNPLIVDDGDALYSETDGTWTDGSTAGVGYLDDYRVNAEDAPGRAVFTVPPLSRPARVTVRFPEGTNRTAAAVVSVVHEGGVRTIDIDQREVGRQWLDVGAFPFGSGGAIEVAHGPSPGFLIADAIKAGGGVHPDARQPWWEMGAESYVPYAGAPDAVTARGDVTIRPAYAETLDPDVYVSIHANASGAGAGSTAHGTSTYRYSCGLYGDHSSSDGATSCDDPGRSQELLDEVHASVLAELRAAWDPGWADRGRLVADFGELRELDDTPGILVETGFFDNLTNPGGVVMSDNQALHDPRWREAFAVGVVRGLARFLAPGSDAPPARPVALAAINGADSALHLSWNAVDGADGYRVLRASLASTRGRAFDEGTVVVGATELLLDSTALVAGDAYAFRVVAANANGEGYPSQAVVARFRGAASDEPAATLVVSAYDRKDAFVQTVDNDDMAAIEHGVALARAHGGSFDGALDESLEAGAVSLEGRRLVDLVVGKDSIEHEPLSAAMRALLESFLDAGGAVILSGEEIGYAMIEEAEAGASADSAAFFLARFGAMYVKDDAETFELVGAGLLADALAENPARLDDGSSLYEVVFPDVWQPDPANAAATAPLTYPDGSAAAIVTDRTALFGAGLEAIVNDDARTALLVALLAHIVPGLPTEREGIGEGEGGEGEPGGQGESDPLRPRALPPSVDPGCGCAASSVPDVRALVGLAIALALLSRRAGTRTNSRSSRRRRRARESECASWWR